MTQEKTCRYGHGRLVNVDRLDGQAVTFGLMFQDTKPQDLPTFLTGLRWLLCPTCGYSELEDSDPSLTMRHLRGENG